MPTTNETPANRFPIWNAPYAQTPAVVEYNRLAKLANDAADKSVLMAKKYGMWSDVHNVFVARCIEANKAVDAAYLAY